MLSPTHDIPSNEEGKSFGKSVPLDRRYEAEQGQHFISGVPAVVRLLVDQMRQDRREGLNTRAFVSGYPGSPLGSLDTEFLKREAFLRELGIIHQPGLNEELAATAVFGSQVASVTHGFRHDGVLGVWYGKAPGLDRAADAIRHGNFAGTGSSSGTLVIVGDDPACKSSTLPSSSENLCADLSLPVIHPGDAQDILDFGRHAVALSRYSGLWTALKLVTVVADGTSSVDLDTERVRCLVPRGAGSPHRVVSTLHQPHTRELERDVYERRIPRALEYAVLNRLNEVTVHSLQDWLGIVASGHTYIDLLDAFRLIGLTEHDLSRLGIRLLRIRMPYPLDRNELRTFAHGLSEIFVVEERKPFIEVQLRAALYGMVDPPLITGKEDPERAPLLRSWGALDADTIAVPLAARLLTRLDPSQLNLAQISRPKREFIPLMSERPAWFCSGCPHSNSTQAPPGALVGTGIGCHGLASRMAPERTGTVLSNTQMGGEGAQWVGAAPFVEVPHIFQNIGDGTLAHSGWLSIRFAVAAGSHITFKLLYNGAMAMTGGQKALGLRSVPDLVSGLRAEGVGRIIITTDDLKPYRKLRFDKGVAVWDRRRTLEAQVLLADEPGVTVLIHDQACAAELRRQRKRGRAPTPTQRVVINQRVCEACGDCGAKTGCLSLHTIETEFGPKTHVDQTSCNFDYSCMEGDCPSFTLVEPRRRSRWRSRTSPPEDSLDKAGSSEKLDLPEPSLAKIEGEHVIRIPGIGGTGVVTVAQILALAASLDGFNVHGLDQTGLSQKAGPVVSDLRITKGTDARPGRALTGGIDLFLVLDVLVALSPEHLSTLRMDRTVLVGSSTWTPTGKMIGDSNSEPLDLIAAKETFERLVRRSWWVDASVLSLRLLGNTAAANLLLVGVAYQNGTLPMSSASIEEAIRQNGVAVQANLEAFRRGRNVAIHGGSEIEPAKALVAPIAAELQTLIDELPDSSGLRSFVAFRAADLVAYQDSRYALRFLNMVKLAASMHSPEIVRALATNLHKLMAYKDEYEVARLHLTSDASSQSDTVGGHGARVTILLHPPILRSLGLRRKLRLGPWFRPVLKILRAGRRLRGTLFDPFGQTKTRRLERQLIREYIELVQQLLSRRDLQPETILEIIDLPQIIKGYEQIKLASVAQYHLRLADLLRRVDSAGPVLVK